MSLFDNSYSHFTFTYRCNGKDVTVNLDKQDATVPQVLEEFMNFMKACGYCFDIDDRLDVVNDFKHDQAFDTMISEEEAESRAYEQTTDGSVKFVNPNWPNDWPDPEVTNFGVGSWVEYDANGVAKQYTNTPYKPKDY